MKRLSLDEVRDALPDLAELRPLLDHLLSRSEADPARTWSGSGRLGTVGSWLVPTESLSKQALADIAAREAAHLAELYALVGRALSALASGEATAAAEAWLAAAALEESAERPSAAAAYAAAAYAASRDERDGRTAGLALRRRARATKALGDLPVALDLYIRSYETAQAVSDLQGSAEAAIGAGNVLEEQGRWHDADRWYRTALAALEAAPRRGSETWQALLNLHIVMRSSGRVEESVPLLQQAAAAAGADPEVSLPFLENARGQLSMARGSFQEAADRFRAALDAAVGARAKVTIRLNLAEALFAQGRLLDAAEQARDAEREAIRMGLAAKLPEVYRLLGRLASEQDDPDAFVLFERALELVRDRHLPALEEAVTLQAYADAEARGGDPDAAKRLSEEASASFAALGFRGMRSRWVDVFGSHEEAEIPLTEEAEDA